MRRADRGVGERAAGFISIGDAGVAISSIDVLSTGGVRRRMAGKLAISSGIAGLVAFSFLIAALVGREALADEQAWRAGVIEAGFWDALFRLHDAAAIAQAVLMIPVVRVLHSYVLRPAGWNSLAALLGAAVYTVLALTIAMIFVTHGSDMLYMIPQAFVGAWLVALNGLQPAGVSWRVRWLGIVAGTGLVIVGLAAAGIAAALGPSVLTAVGPVPKQISAAGVTSTLNEVSHAALDIGTLLGVLTYPVWQTLTGRAMLKTSEMVTPR